MINVLVLTHGDLASELLRAAQAIVPELAEGSAALALPWDVDSDEATSSLKKELRRLEQGSGLLVLTDMFGGTATNLALPFLSPGKIEIITGVNLPMLIKLDSLRKMKLPLAELAQRLTEAGQKSIRVASEFLRQKEAAK